MASKPWIERYAFFVLFLANFDGVMEASVKFINRIIVIKDEKKEKYEGIVLFSVALLCLLFYVFK